jgi:hypothetical protein
MIQETFFLAPTYASSSAATNETEAPIIQVPEEPINENEVQEPEEPNATDNEEEQPSQLENCNTLVF